MDTSVIEKEMQDYFMLLNEAEKNSIVQMIKTFLQSKQTEFDRISIEQYNKELAMSVAEIERGEAFTYDDASKISKRWLNGK